MIGSTALVMGSANHPHAAVEAAADTPASAELSARPVTRQRDAMHDPAKAVVIVDRVVVRAAVVP